MRKYTQKELREMVAQGMAEDNKDKEKLSEKMFLLYKDCRDSEKSSLSKDETWCDPCEAFVVSGGEGNYYRHHWKIDKFEV